MIPGNEFTVAPVYGEFMHLIDLPYTPLTQRTMGGIALNDPSRGRLYQEWEVLYTGTNIEVRPVGNVVAFTLAVDGVTSVSMAFDTNMSIVLAWTTALGAFLYYYDLATTAFITREFPAVSSCRVCVDNPLDFYAGASDIIFGYTHNGSLSYRQQRDAYNVEYTIAQTSKLLTKIGLTNVNRLQFETV